MNEIYAALLKIDTPEQLSIIESMKRITSKTGTVIPIIGIMKYIIQKSDQSIEE